MAKREKTINYEFMLSGALNACPTCRFGLLLLIHILVNTPRYLITEEDGN